VAGGLSERSGERAKGCFAYSVLYDVVSDSERLSRTGIISEAIMPKRSERSGAISAYLMFTVA